MIKSGADMLIATQVALDKIEGFRNESFEPEEIQLILNKSQFRLLDDLVNKNFQQGVIRYEWVRPFMSSKSQTPTWTIDAMSIDAPYPVELYYLIAARGTSTIDVPNATDSWESGCAKSDIDPDSITNAKSKSVKININETGETVDKSHNSFYGAKDYKSPIAEVYGAGLRLYRGDNFIISRLDLDYIIEPNEIDVTSTGDTQWSVSANEKIVDYTVEYMRLSIQDPGYQGNVNDFNTRTQNA